MLVIFLGLTSFVVAEVKANSICESSGMYLVKAAGTDGKQEELVIVGQPIITMMDFVAVDKYYDMDHSIKIAIELTDNAGKKIEKFTRDHILEHMAIVINNEILLSAKIQGGFRKYFQFIVDNKGDELYTKIKDLINQCNNIRKR